MKNESRKVFVRVLMRDGHGRILIVADKSKRSRKWNLPGGKVEIGEAPEAAARREVLEETGLSLGHLTLVHEDRFQVGNIQWHGYFYESQPIETKAYNMEPHKLSRVEFVDLPQAVKHGSRSFLVDVLQRWENEDGYGQPWQMQLRLGGLFKRPSEGSA